MKKYMQGNIFRQNIFPAIASGERYIRLSHARKPERYALHLFEKNLINGKCVCKSVVKDFEH